MVTLQEAKSHLRYDDDADDLYINGLIAAADSAVKNYVTQEPLPDAAAIKQATLLLIGHYDQYRNAEKDMPVEGNYLPAPVRALLYPYRTPTAV